LLLEPNPALSAPCGRLRSALDAAEQMQPQQISVSTRRLLLDPDPALSALPGAWLHSLLDAAAAPHQSVDNIIRRSAGGPFAVTAILLAEPAQQTRKVSAENAQPQNQSVVDIICPSAGDPSTVKPAAN